jgi:hypothetical protein
MNGPWSARLFTVPVHTPFLILLVLGQSGLLSVMPSALADSPTAQAADPPRVSTPDDPSEPQGVAPNCRAEIKKLCQGVRPGGGRIKKCIADNESKLSPPCQKAVQERLEKNQ